MDINTNSKNEKLLKSTLLVSFVVIFAKLFGFVKDIVVAAIYGANIDTDIYNVASRLVYSTGSIFFASISISLVAVYGSKIIEKKNDEANKLISNTFVVFTPIAAILAFLLCVLSRPLASIMGNGLDDNSITKIALFICILSPSLFFQLIFRIIEGMLNAQKKFVLPNLVSIIQSFVFIIIPLLLNNKFGVYALVFSFLLSFILETIYLLFCIRKIFKFKICKPFKDVEVKEIVKMSMPIIIGTAVLEISHLVDQSIASNLVEGTISAITYSYTLHNFVNAIIIGNFCTIMYTSFISSISNKNINELIEKLRKSIIYILLIILPISIITFFKAESIVKLVYMRGNFSEEDAIITASALKGYSFGFVFLGLREILVKAHYSFKDMKTPMINGIIAVILNIIFSLLLSKYIGVLGITLSTSLSYFVAFLISMFTIKKHSNISCLNKKSMKSIVSIIIASFIIIIELLLLNDILTLGYFLDFALNTIIIFVSYFLILVIFQNNETLELINLIKLFFKNKFKKKRGNIC